MGNHRQQYLKLRPVHVHARAMDITEPLQIFFRASRSNHSLKISVNCFITADRKGGFLCKHKDRLRSFVFPAHTSLTNLWFSVRLRWHLTSSSTSLRKLNLFSSNCWHWLNICSMFSMYWGVHLFSSSRAFSYFSLVYMRTKKIQNIMLLVSRSILFFNS